MSSANSIIDVGCKCKTPVDFNVQVRTCLDLRYTFFIQKVITYKFTAIVSLPFGAFLRKFYAAACLTILSDHSYNLSKAS